VQEKDFQQHKIIDNGKREGMSGSAEERRGREGYRGRGGAKRAVFRTLCKALGNKGNKYKK